MLGVPTGSILLAEYEVRRYLSRIDPQYPSEITLERWCPYPWGLMWVSFRVHDNPRRGRADWYLLPNKKFSRIELYK